MLNRPMRSALQGILVFCTCLVAPAGFCEDEPHWGFSIIIGGHLPNLTALNKGLYNSKLVGDAEVLLYEAQLGSQSGQTGQTGTGEVIDQNITETQPFEFDNPLPETNLSSHAGVEFLWHANDRHSFILGTGSMENVATNRVIGNIPMQQYFVRNTVLSEHRAKISYTEYTLGWRYDWLRKSKLKLYTRLSVHEVFDIDFRDDFSFTFLASPIDELVGVRRVMVVEAQTAALMMGQLGLGGEYFLLDWLSLGFDAGWVFGGTDFTLKDVRARDDFLNGDNVNRSGMPYRELSDGTLGYLQHGTTSADVADPAAREGFYTPIHLRFDGARFLFRINMYF